jgi:putative effector of murein hydrolase
LSLEAAAWLFATIALYLLARAAQRAAGGHPAMNTVLLPSIPLIAALWAAELPYARYAAGGDLLLWALGPATVALALPAVVERRALRRHLWPLLAATVAGSVAAVVSAVGIAWLMGGSDVLLRSISPKSVTTAIAWPLSRTLGGEPGLTALSVIATGVFGALVGAPIIRMAGVRDPDAIGAAIGATSHGIGTARAFQIDPRAGLFAGLAMALNGLITALILPLIAALCGW